MVSCDKKQQLFTFDLSTKLPDNIIVLSFFGRLNKLKNFAYYYHQHYEVVCSRYDKNGTMTIAYFAHATVSFLIHINSIISFFV